MYFFLPVHKIYSRGLEWLMNITHGAGFCSEGSVCVKYLAHRSGARERDSRLLITISITQFRPCRVSLKACGNQRTPFNWPQFLYQAKVYGNEKWQTNSQLKSALRVPDCLRKVNSPCLSNAVIHRAQGAEIQHCWHLGTEGNQPKLSNGMLIIFSCREVMNSPSSGLRTTWYTPVNT